MPAPRILKVRPASTPSGRFSSLTRAAGAALLVCLLGACQFEGYTPPAPPPKPLTEGEKVADTLDLGQRVQDDLDCAVGRCQARYRVIVPQAGTLYVAVAGPIRAEAATGPRLARVVLEGVGMQALARTVVDTDSVSPLVVYSEVDRGVNFVLVNVLGGKVHYTVDSSFAPKATAAPAPPPQPEASEMTGWRPRIQFDRPSPGQKMGTAAEPGDTSDGADFAYDPSRDLGTLRTYAFAQDPAAELAKGEPGKPVGDPFVKRQIQREIRYYLADRAVYQVPAEEADFLISIQLGSRSTTWYSIGYTLYDRSYNLYFDRWRGMGMWVAPHTYQDGMLIIDFVDPHSGDLIWHGWTVEPISLSARDDSILKTAVQNVLSQI